MGEGLREAEGVIAHARCIAKNAGFHILISDPTATVVKSFPDTSGGADLAAKGLVAGSVWQEGLVGTNGLGTCAATREAVTIAGPSHFYEAFAAYKCSAAPILAPDGELWGVFNLTGLDDLQIEAPFAHEFSLRTADLVSGVLFRMRHRKDRVIALSNCPRVPLSLNSLVALDCSDVVIGATRRALDLLGAKTFADVLNRPLKTLLACDGPDGTSRSATDTQGRRLFLTPFLPSRSNNCARTNYPISDHNTGDVCDNNRALDRVAGSDTRLRSQAAACRRLLDIDLPLLLLGETGVGKDTFARAFHAESPRADKPYIAVNCAAIPESLLSSELFGYAPGTFTGGLKRGKEGRIVASNGGTLFLDEIGDMPLELQAHLLRVLEDRLVTPLGSAESVAVDIRVICATHRDLAELIANGAFRKDLYFRIKGVQVSLPPLREREDFVELLNRLIANEVGSSATDQIVISQSVVDTLQSYRWPGNIRELKSVIRYVLAVCSNNTVTINDLPDEIRDPDAACPFIAGVPSDEETSGSPFGPDQCEAEQKQRIVGTLSKNKWNISKTAKQLEMSRATLHRKILKLKIVSPNARG